jgi:hypothetical protein
MCFHQKHFNSIANAEVFLETSIKSGPWETHVQDIMYESLPLPQNYNALETKRKKI